MFRDYNLQRLQIKQEEQTEEEEMKQQQRMTIMKDLIKNLISKGSKDAQNRWLHAWTDTGWEDAMQKWYEWLEETKMRDEKRQYGGNASAQGGAND